jgi:hypothetical protein
MSWLDRLKNENTPGTHATKPTKPNSRDEKAGFVGFVAYPHAHIQKSQAADEGGINTDSTTQDAYCWPRSDACNGSELATMATRLERFARIGMDVDQAEKLADKLLTRDRESDDRNACVECSSLNGGTGGWRCMALRQRGARDPGLPMDYVSMLTRCPSFTDGDPQAYGSFTSASPVNETRLVHLGRAPGPWLTPSETAAAQQYHQHHAQCPQCQGAGRGYNSHCSDGAALWNQYQLEDVSHD